MPVEGTTDSVSLAGPSQQIIFDHSHDGCVAISVWSFPGHSDLLERGPLRSRVLSDLMLENFWQIAVGMRQVGSIKDNDF